MIMEFLIVTINKHIQCTPGPLYNMVHYNTVLDITLIIVGPHLDFFSSPEPKAHR